MGMSAVFLDRDGVINVKAADAAYVTSWEEFAFLPSALEGLRLLAALDVPIVVVTNQRGVARGLMSEDELSAIHTRMRADVAAAGARIDAVYACVHNFGCLCRKPEVGMFRAAAEDLGIRLNRSVVVGDALSDMLAARRIGATAILVGSTSVGGLGVDFVGRDLLDAAHWLAGRAD